MWCWSWRWLGCGGVSWLACGSVTECRALVLACGLRRAVRRPRRPGVPGFRVHDLRHTAASIWLAAGADPKVVQRVLGHACAAMTMDLYGHRVWDGTVAIRGRC